MFKIGKVAQKKKRYLARLPDGIVALRLDAMKNRYRGNYSDLQATQVIVSAIEIKTRFSGSSLGRNVINISSDLQHCHFGDETLVCLIPVEHTGQLLHQCILMRLKYVLYIAADGTGIILSVLFRFPGTALERSLIALETAVVLIVNWVHIDNPKITSFVSSSQKKKINAGLLFRKSTETHIRQKDCFQHLKLCEKGAKRF